jgi:hypothetical protein
MVKRIIDSHAHVGDIFHENKNITFKTNVKKGNYDDPFIDCERSGYTKPLMPKNVDELINAGQYRSWEWTLENCAREMDEHPELQYVVMLPIWPNTTFEEYLAASKLDPRIIPFTSPVLNMSTEEMVKKLKQDIARGAKGLKLHPTIQNMPLDDPKTEAAVKVFTEADLPVLTHAGANPYYTADSPWSKQTNPVYSDVETVSEFCHKWPNTKIICAHRCTTVDTLYEQTKGLKNVYTDTSMCCAEKMRKGVELMGEDHILFGTDVPFGSFHNSISELKKAFPEGSSVFDKVAYTNMATLMHLEF